MIERSGPVAAAEALHDLVNAVEAAAEEHKIAFLASDVDADGGKLILTAGAPSITGDDEERMLLALRRSSMPISRFRFASAFIVAPYSPATSGPSTVARIR